MNTIATKQFCSLVAKKEMVIQRLLAVRKPQEKQRFSTLMFQNSCAKMTHCQGAVAAVATATILAAGLACLAASLSGKVVVEGGQKDYLQRLVVTRWLGSSRLLGANPPIQSSCDGSWMTTEPGTIEHLEQVLKQDYMLEMDEDQSSGTSSSQLTSENRDDNLNQGYFPTLESTLIVNDFTGESVPFPINSNTPIPVESELFVGTLQLTLQPLEESHDPHFDTGHQPHFDFHLQGNFTQDLPLDQVYMGAQITRPMTGLGRIGKQICHVLLKLLGRNIPGEMRYSFGTFEEDGKDEYPFISFPLSTAMTDLRVVTSQSRNDSDMDNESNKNRTPTAAKVGPMIWDSSSKYSMSYTSDHVDLASWKIRTPFDFQLQRIWGKGTPMQLIIYHQESPDSPRTYLLQLQLQPKEVQESTVE